MIKECDNNIIQTKQRLQQLKNEHKLKQRGREAAREELERVSSEIENYEAEVKRIEVENSKIKEQLKQTEKVDEQR